MIMKITIDFTKSAQENADYFYKRSKKLTQKKAGAEAAIINLEKRLKAAKTVTETTQKKRIIVTEKKWYQKFHWFYTSGGLLVIGGRDAQQNELLNSRHFEDNDLFFHANIFGAAVTILKDGVKASKEAKEETAQFAACYSSAWKEGLPAVDVYAMRRNQVSKSSSKGSISSGSFLLSGEREWYKNTGLSLVLFVKDEKLNANPEICFYRLKEAGKAPDTYVLVKQGKIKKSDAAKKISKSLDFPDIDTIMQQLPAGEFRIVK
jgi:predicted ribosome quality control (RQC) complex YloA/Tae2 family protein